MFGFLLPVQSSLVSLGLQKKKKKKKEGKKESANCLNSFGLNTFSVKILMNIFF